MIFVVVLALVLGLVIAVVVGVAKDPGPTPLETALGYEHAWDGLDFDVVYRLSGPELHEGLAKADFIAAKQAAYPGGEYGNQVEEAVAEAESRQGDSAAVLTRLTRRDGTVVHNEVRLERRSRGGRSSPTTCAPRRRSSAVSGNVCALSRRPVPPLAASFSSTQNPAAPRRRSLRPTTLTRPEPGQRHLTRH